MGINNKTPEYNLFIFFPFEMYFSFISRYFLPLGLGGGCLKQKFWGQQKFSLL